MSRHSAKLTCFALIALGTAACSDPGTTTAPAATASRPEASAVKFWDANAAANWNEHATTLATRRPAGLNALRLYPYLSLAQLRAAEAAEAINPHAPTSAAIGAASAVVLESYFPADVAEIESMLDAQEAAIPTPNAKHEDFAAGEAIGRAAAARVLAYAAGDRVGLADPGSPPTTPGSWIRDARGVARGNYGVRLFFPARTDEFRPPPPPAFGSPEFLAALAEVKQIGDTRTAEQTAIANYWNVNQSPSSDAAMNNLAVSLVRQYRLSDTESARVFFLMNGAAFDALTACFEAKYFYWFIRPSQADPTIKVVFPPPPHPSYPSAHSCISGSSTAVLAAKFPSEAERVRAMAEEAGMSRVYAGIHYRFDSQAGLALGRAVAARALATDLDQVAVH
jgi:hypothetical protein